MVVPSLIMDTANQDRRVGLPDERGDFPWASHSVLAMRPVGRERRALAVWAGTLPARAPVIGWPPVWVGATGWRGPVR